MVTPVDAMPRADGQRRFADARLSGITMMNDSTTWHTAIYAWADYLRAAGRPATTVGQRIYHLTRLADDVGGLPSTLLFEQLAEWMATRGWKPNTLRSYRGSFRAFYSFALAVGIVTRSPAHLLPPVNVPRGAPRPTPETIYRQALLDADERSALMVQLAAHCGLRRAEIAGLRRADVVQDLDGGWSVRVRGKGGHVRLVPLPGDLPRALVEWGTPDERSTGWVFPGRCGGHGPVSGKPLTPAHVGKLVSGLLPEGWTCHTLRHRCATVAYASTRDLRAVQELLGHAKPETTALYTRVPFNTVRAAVAAAAA